ncbi:MAG TPA: N-6 DNA methylase [Ktedonobacteraceae bacterium]|jgi:SAM-dependent methyltransferase
MKHEARETLALDWYETGLSSDERKQRGHFSTPHALVDQILDACGYTPSADLRHLRVLDPACGSGNFLARAARRLCLALDARGLSEQEIGVCVQRNIWGLDPDPVACLLAEMQVRAALDATCRTPDSLPPLHIHQVDSLALAWQPCIDLLVANPPYLATKNTDLSHYSQARRRGQADSYLLFLELALRAVLPGGWIGLVLPDPVLARANAAPERANLLRECTVQHIWHLSGVFEAEVGAVVIVARKTPPSISHRICWTRAHWHPKQVLAGSEATSQQVGQALLASQPGAELRYLLGHPQGDTSECLRRSLHETYTHTSKIVRLLPLEALVDIKRGEEIGRNSELLRPLAACDNGLPALRGGIDLRPYTMAAVDLGIERTALKKPIERYLRPKLLVVKSTERLQAALDTRGHVVLQTLYLLHLRSPISRNRSTSPASPFLEGMGEEEILETFYFLLALLNSRLLSTYVYHLHTAYKLVQPQIEQAVLARLPVVWGSASARREIAERAQVLTRACSKAGPVVEWDQQLLSVYEEQERAVYALYAQLPNVRNFRGQRSRIDG